MDTILVFSRVTICATLNCGRRPKVNTLANEVTESAEILSEKVGCTHLTLKSRPSGDARLPRDAWSTAYVAAGWDTPIYHDANCIGLPRLGVSLGVLSEECIKKWMRNA